MASAPAISDQLPDPALHNGQDCHVSSACDE
eukprot:CAMPEP_0203938252 /NCGR_PEP_ID=MMETSP0359-20131031/75331_1 /ASSEMBLY_ACC=CAM_ASM_000338 /TAXON_ID=268821 /ORGANISM="Scrippsiella Hangoei, Strain SHTV-5" /LENGTH=30 /DNA_ID= /DNA_START= /DNA_END= /DNA_ORIENTATION=